MQGQTLADFEIVVVDNAVDSDLRRRVTELKRMARLAVRYVAEPQLGLHNARHAGVRVAHGDLLVFTDDDHTFEPEWLEAYTRAFSKHPEMAAASGPVRLVWESRPPEWLVEYIRGKKMFPILGLLDVSGEFRLDAKGYVFGGNMAIRREALFEADGFNPDLFGDKYLGDGEVGLYRRMWKHNMLIGYAPAAVVYHHVPPRRMTVEYFCARMANEGIAEIYSSYQGQLPARLGLCKDGVAIVVRNAKRWLRAVSLKGRTDKLAVDIQIDAARTRSQLTYVIRLIFDQKRRRLVMKRDWLND